MRRWSILAVNEAIFLTLPFLPFHLTCCVPERQPQASFSQGPEQEDGGKHDGTVDINKNGKKEKSVVIGRRSCARIVVLALFL